ncbi:UbiA prenyltransferase family-domain-containing protein [Xylariomycetidae sp. FL2044]|nr:UbiA prenyltransferase family-domain-containing protein [Xylariomycetidae sp. FL2044]
MPMEDSKNEIASRGSESWSQAGEPQTLLHLILSLPGRLVHICGLIWDFTESNFGTFVVPNTAFGILGALAAARLTDGLPEQPPVWEIMQRLPVVIAFNWFNVLIFDLANQRSPESVQEDILNKPWRPIPVGKVTADQTRRAMLVAVPTVLAFNYALGVWRQGIFIQILTWLYNDLRGGDEVVRDLIISIAYGLFNSASLELATGCRAPISQAGVAWTALVSAVILTTMQVQDLKDQAGDRSRGRQTVALWLGDQVSRVSIAFFVCLWSLVCAYFWDLDVWGYVLPAVSGAVVAARVLLKRHPAEDAYTWRLWCWWTMTLYLLPLTSLIRP